MNGGLVVVNPSSGVYNAILDHLSSDAAINMDFADQSLLSDLFNNRWVPLPYIYNALKTLKWENVHPQIWRDDKVKNIHYILAPKPWDEMDGEGNFIGKDATHAWWVTHNQERLRGEKESEIKVDGF